MASAASASIRSLAPRAAPRAPTMDKPTELTAPLIDVPTAPTTGVANPETQAQETWIVNQLSPANAAFVGNKYKPDVARAGSQLRQSLAGFGAFDFTQGTMNEYTNLDSAQKEGTGESLGEEYRNETIRAQAAANSRGMLNSRMADEAVGLAWSRLNTQKRDFFTRYATTVSSSLQQMQAEISGLTTSLLDLYGQDIQYAKDNPVLGPDTTTEPSESVDTGAPAAPTTGASRILWKGKAKPKMGVIAKRQGVKPAQLQRKTRGGGKGYVVVRK